MRATTLRLGLSLTVVLCFWANPASAQQVYVVPTVPYEPAYVPYSPPVFGYRPPPPLSSSRVHGILNQHGVACQVDPYYANCANWHYEMNFIFGSCRSFFREDCHSNAGGGRNCAR
ncbi:MAG: hypothetical protein HYX68_21020 [Planctomycetes bacterium]|jgi:hypothetical protein|nr:hypothetical protein [Planctomycetota bacterium]